MNFIQQQIATVSLLNKPSFIAGCAGKSALPMTKKMRREKLGVVRIFSTVELDQRQCVIAALLAGKLMHQLGKIGFPHARRAGQ